MTRKKDTEGRKERKLTLLRSEMQRVLLETSQQRSILTQMVEGKSAEAIANYEHISLPTAKRHMKKIVETYKDNFTTEVGYWTELLMARYERLFEMLYPLALNRDIMSIKFTLEILEAQRALVGADAVDRQRQQTVDNYQQQVQGELTISVFDRYTQLLNEAKPEGYADVKAPTPALLVERAVGAEEIQAIPQEEDRLYRNDDSV